LASHAIKTARILVLALLLNCFTLQEPTLFFFSIVGHVFAVVAGDFTWCAPKYHAHFNQLYLSKKTTDFDLNVVI
jgi:hypothetical protein